jgi:hypothetical protein
MSFDRGPRQRGEPLSDVGAEVVAELLAEIDDDEQLSAALGVDLTPPGPDPSHAPAVYLSLEAWFERSEEIHRLLRERRSPSPQSVR